jgi:hypothetical protein
MDKAYVRNGKGKKSKRVIPRMVQTEVSHFKNVWPCIVTKSLWIKPTDALNSNCIDIATLRVSGSPSAHHQEFLAVGWNPAPGSKRSSNCIEFTNADVRLRTRDGGQQSCPKHVESHYQYNWNSVHLLVLFTKMKFHTYCELLPVLKGLIQ